MMLSAVTNNHHSLSSNYMDQPVLCNRHEMKSTVQSDGRVVTQPQSFLSVNTPDDCKRESFRLASFDNYHSAVSPIVLMAAGFYYVGSNDMTKCFSCGRCVENWQVGDDPKDIRWHRSNCEHAKGFSSSNIALDTIPPEKPTKAKQAESPTSNMESLSVHDNSLNCSENEANCSEQLQSTARKLAKQDENLRHPSFNTGQNSRTSAHQYQSVDNSGIPLHVRAHSSTYVKGNSYSVSVPQHALDTTPANEISTPRIAQSTGDTDDEQLDEEYQECRRDFELDAKNNYLTEEPSYHCSGSLYETENDPELEYFEGGRIQSGLNHLPPSPVEETTLTESEKRSILEESMASDIVELALEKTEFSRSHIKQVIEQQISDFQCSFQSYDGLLAALSKSRSELFDFRSNLDQTSKGNVKKASTIQPSVSRHTDQRFGASTSAEKQTKTHKQEAKSVEEIQRERRCKVCLDNEADVLFRPCSHLCACSTCARKLNQCPICRQKIETFMHVFIS